MSTLKVNELRHLSNTGTANIVLESNATTNLQVTSTLGLTVNGTLTVSGVSTFNGNVVVGNASTDTVLLTSTVSGSANFSGFTGEIRMYAGNAAGDSAPAGWLYCNGDEIGGNTTGSPDHYNGDGTGNDYQALYNLLKASADWGNTGSLTWLTNVVKLPDFRSRSPIGVHTGAANTIGSGLTQRTLSDTAGTETHTMITAEMPSHTHVMTCASANTGVSATHSHTHTLAHTHGYSGTTSTIGNHNHNNGSYNLLLRTTGNWTFGGGDYTAGEPELTSGAAIVDSGSHSNTWSGTTNSQNTSTTSDASSTTVAMTDPSHNHTVTAATTGSGNAHTILSPVIAVHYIIKV